MGTHNRKDQLTANDGKVLIGAAAAAAAAVSFPFTGDRGSRGGSETQKQRQQSAVQRERFCGKNANDDNKGKYSMHQKEDSQL